VQGAPEYIIPLCTQTLNDQQQIVKNFHECHELVLQQVIHQQIANMGLKPFTYAFKEIPVEDLN
jgi:hypothetical protein